MEVSELQKETFFSLPDGDNFSRRHNRPFVTLSFAQSLDGCVSVTAGRRLVLSGREALAFTHTLRAWHDAILVGIGTVLADDPRLTVRHVQGKNPQPVIVDSGLRFPLGSRLMRENPLAPWIVTGAGSVGVRREALERAGSTVIPAPVDGTGKVRITGALALLAARGIGRLMVEGGSRIITSFLVDRMVDKIVLTVTPLFVGGVHSIEPNDPHTVNSLPRLRDVRYERFGQDLIVMGHPEWSNGNVAAPEAREGRG